ncbi:MAG: N-6 DNA methylase, partial [Candidatus Delongbacteria bacterium]|nr:N-6 DNA methylase [Candidatus Delongbacteria bacterium]
MKKNKFITIERSSEIFKVSTATVNNWIKTGLLIKEINGIRIDSVEELLKDINSGRIKRLNSRANKKISDITFIPKELFSKEDDHNIASLISKIKKNRFNIDEFISELLNIKNGEKPLNNNISSFIHKNNLILDIDPELIYQSLKSEGNKSRDGSYYTPQFIVTDILNDLKILNNFKIYDPCCGTGQFLKSIDQNFNDISIYGSDIDLTAVNITKFHLGIKNKNRFTINHNNSLEVNERSKYDIVVTNPPWGAHYSNTEKNLLKKLFPEAGSGDSLEYFLLKGFYSLKNNGVMSYILPESLLYVKRFSNIRKFFLENSSILKIKNYGRVFSQVFTNTIRIDIKRSIPEKKHFITLNNNLKIEQKCFLYEFDYQYNINTTEKDRLIIKKVFAHSHFTLKNKSEWSLGIVTGNNFKYVNPGKSNFHTIPIITGRNIEQFIVNRKVNYLYNDISKFQQVPKNNLYIAKEKLVYKFISNKLVFAYDNTGTYTLNSANILIPDLKNYPIKVVLAIMNSEIMDFIYRNKFNSLKVLRSNLEKLPFPVDPDKKIIKEIELYV